MKAPTHKARCPWCQEEDKDVVILGSECPEPNPRIEIYTCQGCTPKVREKLTAIIAATYVFHEESK